MERCLGQFFQKNTAKNSQKARKCAFFLMAPKSHFCHYFKKLRSQLSACLNSIFKAREKLRPKNVIASSLI